MITWMRRLPEPGSRYPTAKSIIDPPVSVPKVAWGRVSARRQRSIRLGHQAGGPFHLGGHVLRLEALAVSVLREQQAPSAPRS
jgi:hypothetical protein